MPLDSFNALEKPGLKPKIKRRGWKRIIRNKYFLIFLVLVAAFLVYHFFLKAAKAVPEYSLTTVRKGTLTTTVSGSGQVSAVNQIDINPPASAVITSVNVKVGDKVKAGQKLATLDETTNILNLKQAQASLLGAQANYNEVAAGADATDVKLSQLSVDQAQTALASAQNDLAQTKDSVAADIAQAQEDLNDLLDTSPLAVNNKRSQVVLTNESALNAAQNALDVINKILNDQGAKNTLGVLDATALPATQTAYQVALTYISPAKSSLAAAKLLRTDANLNQSVSDTLNLLNAVLSAANDAFYLMQETTTSSTLTQSNLDSFKSSASAQISGMTNNISSVQTTWQSLTDAITTARNTLTNAQLSGDQQITAAENKVTSAQQSLTNAQTQYAKTTAPATEQSLQQAKAQLISAQAQLQSAQTAYDKNIITSPIDGQVAQLNATVGLTADPSTALATIVTPQKIAVIQFNEVDTAKLKVGQDAVLTFDALPDRTVNGKVSEVSGVGVSTQGVVNYEVKISFDNPENDVLPGMTVSAVVTTEVKPDVLLAPSQAVKSVGSLNYVEVLNNYTSVPNSRLVTSADTPQRINVTIGDSNDTMTEITSGLTEGESIVLQIVSGQTTTTNASSGANFRLPGLGGAGGDNFRTTTGGAGGASSTGR